MRNAVFLACVAVLAARAAAADDLPAREAAGQAAAATPAGSKYDAALMPWMQEAGAACYPPGSPPLPAGEVGPLTVVANVTWAGRLINIEVSPPTKTAACVGAELSQYQFPAPPADRFPLLLIFSVSN
jgi:hypothetical protein